MALPLTSGGPPWSPINKARVSSGPASEQAHSPRAASSPRSLDRSDPRRAASYTPLSRSNIEPLDSPAAHDTFSSRQSPPHTSSHSYSPRQRHHPQPPSLTTSTSNESHASLDHGTPRNAQKDEKRRSCDPSEVEQPPKKKRTRLNSEQSALLKQVWGETCFPSSDRRAWLEEKTGLSVRQVQVWFQNQRQKQRNEDYEASKSFAADAPHPLSGPPNSKRGLTLHHDQGWSSTGPDPQFYRRRFSAGGMTSAAPTTTSSTLAGVAPHGGYSLGLGGELLRPGTSSSRPVTGFSDRPGSSSSLWVPAASRPGSSSSGAPAPPPWTTLGPQHHQHHHHPRGGVLAERPCTSGGTWVMGSGRPSGNGNHINSHHHHNPFRPSSTSSAALHRPKTFDSFAASGKLGLSGLGPRHHHHHHQPSSPHHPPPPSAPLDIPHSFAFSPPQQEQANLRPSYSPHLDPSPRAAYPSQPREYTPYKASSSSSSAAAALGCGKRRSPSVPPPPTEPRHVNRPHHESAMDHHHPYKTRSAVVADTTGDRPDRSSHHRHEGRLVDSQTQSMAETSSRERSNQHVRPSRVEYDRNGASPPPPLPNASSASSWERERDHHYRGDSQRRSSRPAWYPDHHRPVSYHPPAHEDDDYHHHHDQHRPGTGNRLPSLRELGFAAVHPSSSTTTTTAPGGGASSQPQQQRQRTPGSRAASEELPFQGSLPSIDGMLGGQGPARGARR